MIRGEIGSEFHSMPCVSGSGILIPEQVKDYALTFSGRTAIETVLNNEPHIKKALLPSYCCDSMIEPFRRAGIDVSFFPVEYAERLNIDITVPDDVNCVLWCNYFGFNQQMPDFGEFLRYGGVLIEDITHSFYSIQQYHAQSQYLVASIRKWEPLNCGGYCASVNKAFGYKPIKEAPQLFLSEKRNAMISKAEYLNGNDAIDKAQFLRDFSKTNARLAEYYSELKMDSASEEYIRSANQALEKAQRIANAKRLYKGIRTNEILSFMFEESQMDCPLFVPIVIQNGFRDIVRKEMISHEIYCPVHWPHPKACCESSIYNIELSLICDQRYTEKDMDRIVSVLNEIINHI